VSETALRQRNYFLRHLRAMKQHAFRCHPLEALTLRRVQVSRGWMRWGLRQTATNSSMSRRQGLTTGAGL